MIKRIVFVAIAVLAVVLLVPAAAKALTQSVMVVETKACVAHDLTKFKVTQSDPQSGRVLTNLDWEVIRSDGTISRSGTRVYSWSADPSSNFHIRVNGEKTVRFNIYYYDVGKYHLISDITDYTLICER